jgi:hypothetical protein
MLGREFPEFAVAAQQDRSGMAFRKGKGKSVMDGDLWKAAHDLLRAKNLVARQVHDFEPAAH